MKRYRLFTLSAEMVPRGLSIEIEEHGDSRIGLSLMEREQVLIAMRETIDVAIDDLGLPKNNKMQLPIIETTREKF